MNNRPFSHHGSKPGRYSHEASVRDSLSRDDLRDAITSWIIDCEIRLSPKTTMNRKWLTDKLMWWFDTFDVEVCDKRSMQKFFHYLATGHKEPGGRWGTKENPSTDPDARTEMRPRSRANYFRWLRTFFLWCIDDGTLDVSPLVTLKPPAHKDDQITPFTLEQVTAMIKGTKEHSRAPVRDEALIMLLLDTGARAAEIVGLNWEDYSLSERCIRVKGKGNTHRVIPLNAPTMKAMINYVKGEKQKEDKDPLFVSVGGHKTGERLTPDGLGQIIRNIGRAAGIEVARCSPHTFRHTFAIEYLRDGGDLATLQTMYGHSDLSMTRRYVAIAQNDVRAKHKAHSPVNRLKKK